MNAEVVSLDNAIEAYRKFDDGSPKKYIIDPHNTLKMTQRGATTQRESAVA